MTLGKNNREKRSAASKIINFLPSILKIDFNYVFFRMNYGLKLFSFDRKLLKIL
jgi:mannitol-specific phosphotransferase system IIBC component